MEILSLQKIGKQYLGRNALSNITFRISAGEVMGLLGPNGAGKTTLLRIIAGIINPDQGKITHSLNKSSSSIGYLPEERGLYKKMKVLDQLVFFGKLKGLSEQAAKQKALTWLDKFGLTDRKESKLEQLSKGMQQKVQMIVAFLHDPELVILDEPFSGFDPINQGLASKMMFDLRKKGTSFILSTHRMDTIPTYCSHILMLNKGSIVLSGTVEDIRNQYSERKYLVVGKGLLKDADSFAIENSERKDAVINAVISTKNGYEVNQVLHDILKGLTIHTFSELKPGFEEIFLKVVQMNQENLAIHE